MTSHFRNEDKKNKLFSEYYGCICQQGFIDHRTLFMLFKKGSNCVYNGRKDKEE